MPRKQKKYHYIYRTTNLLTKNYYIGMHSTNNLNDGYMGSGDRIRRSIKKYGEENFKIEILEFLPNRSSLKDREKEIVNKELLCDSLCLNLKPGGHGGFNNNEHMKKCSEYGNIAFKKRLLNDVEFKEKYTNIGKNLNKVIDEKGIRRYGDWTGKNHTLETIEKMKRSKKGQGSGKLNSQYGTFWITNKFENKKIKKEDFIPEGWYKGRILKFTS